MDKVGGAIDGVANESWGGGEPLAGLIGFFTKEGEGGVLGGEGGRNHYFDGTVGFSYEVDNWDNKRKC